MDSASGSVVFAYTGIVTPDAVPTTIVLDRQGRVAARIIGRVEPAILEAILKTEIARH
jgi:hypothetical protein